MSHKYLEYLREHNRAKASICSYCKNRSVDIIAEKHQIKYVCSDHYISPTDCILDVSVPGVLHYTYPQGKKPGLMDPNIGGYIPRNKVEQSGV
jgi:hypothetical protein